MKSFPLVSETTRTQALLNSSDYNANRISVDIKLSNSIVFFLGTLGTFGLLMGMEKGMIWERGVSYKVRKEFSIPTK